LKSAKSPHQDHLPFAKTSDSEKSAAQLVAFIDGGSRGNPGEAGAGVFFQLNQLPWRGLYLYLGKQTNNYAEYSALLHALEYTLKHGYRRLDIYADSELLVKQMVGTYKVKNPALRLLHAQAMDLKRQFDRFSIRHVRREYNRDADALANKAQDLRASGEDQYS
jgi:ribonuclease HI